MPLIPLSALNISPDAEQQCFCFFFFSLGGSLRRWYVLRGALAQPLPPSAESRYRRHGGAAGAADCHHPAKPVLRGGQRQAAGGQPNVPALPSALFPL